MFTFTAALCTAMLDTSAMELQQTAMSESIVHDDRLNLDGLRLLGGLDTQWVDDHRGFAVLSVLSWPELSLVHTEYSQTVTQIP